MMNEDRFVIISTDEFEDRIYDNVDNKFLNLEQILDIMNKRKMKKNNDFGHYEIQVTDKSKRKKHYGVNGLEPIDAMKMGLFTYLEYIGFLKGNIIKYVCRCDYKNGIEDLYKARDYIDYLIDAYKRKGD